MDTKVFSGFGDASDPVSKLRKIVEEQYKIDEKKEKNNKKEYKNEVYYH